MRKVRERTESRPHFMFDRRHIWLSGSTIVARVEFDVSDGIVNTVDMIEGRFNDQGIATSINARHLFALTLHAQLQESPGRSVRIAELLDAFFRDNAFFDYYRSTYGDRKLTFNRALHVVHHMGELSKFPWTPTPD